MSRSKKERMIMKGIDRMVDSALEKLNLHSSSKSYSNDYLINILVIN